MKMGIEHRVPLSAAALAVLEQMRPLRRPADLVFPSPVRPGQPLSDMTLTKVLRDTGLADRATVHGFRSAFRTWAAERTSAPHAVCEMALAHRVGSDVERSYVRSDLFEKRRGADGPVGGVCGRRLRNGGAPAWIGRVSMRLCGWLNASVWRIKKIAGGSPTETLVKSYYTLPSPHPVVEQLPVFLRLSREDRQTWDAVSAIAQRELRSGKPLSPRVGRVGGRRAGGEAQTASETRAGPECEPCAELAGRCRRSGAGRSRVPSDTKLRKERPEGRRQGMRRGWFRLRWRSARRSASATRRLSGFGWPAQSRHGNAFGTTTPHGGSSVPQNSALHIGCAPAAALRLLRHDGDSRRRTTEAHRG